MASEAGEKRAADGSTALVEKKQQRASAPPRHDKIRFRLLARYSQAVLCQVVDGELMRMLLHYHTTRLTCG